MIDFPQTSLLQVNYCVTQLGARSQKMKVLIILLAVILLVFAGVSLLCLWVILSGAVKVNPAPLFLLIIALLVYLLLVLRVVIRFFLRRDQKTANAVAITIGFHAWCFATRPIDDFLKKVAETEGLNGDFLIIGGFVFPLIVAIFVTCLLISGVRLAYSPMGGEPGAGLNSESLRSSP